ncbi:hypothetical protein HBA54_19250 [Pelagibius litoralis]|uniref:Uncharacterized protein n=1 Tax=Pelagibius litoralis TaxID=374515 RepID=A0A967KEH5_9PROT|nr:hypothetical protein [Pelagibius litoralis]NIA70740.1 hypothetical protein [Pelagibius litoralis]
MTHPRLIVNNDEPAAEQQKDAQRQAEAKPDPVFSFIGKLVVVAFFYIVCIAAIGLSE